MKFGSLLVLLLLVVVVGVNAFNIPKQQRTTTFVPSNLFSLQHNVQTSSTRTTVLSSSSSSSSSFTTTDDEFDGYIPPMFEKTDEECKRIEKRLKTNIIFQELSNEFDNIINSFEKVTYNKGDVIMKQGDKDENANFMLLLDDGECSIIIDDKPVNEPYGTMLKGSMIGELALLYDTPRSATVIAKTKVIAFRLNREPFKYFSSPPRAQENSNETLKTELKTIDQVIDSLSGVSKRYGGDIIRKFKPERKWLWRRWTGTILEHAWKTALVNIMLSIGVNIAIHTLCEPTWTIGSLPDKNHKTIQRMVGLAKVWEYQKNITTFILTFFLSQAYGLWKGMYTTARKIQGRLNDFNMLLASTAERDPTIGTYTKNANKLLDDIGQYSRLFHVFMWSKFSKRFNVLLSERGLSRMLSRGILSRKQYRILSKLKGSETSAHDACTMWMLTRSLDAMKKKNDETILPNDHSLRDMLFHKITDLRSTYAGIGDTLDGRIPLVYVHFVQILVDTFLLLAPFALYSELGIWSIAAVGLLTLFYSGLLDLSKILLDPLENDDFYKDSINMDIGVLIAESNSGSTRWKLGGNELPY